MIRSIFRLFLPAFLFLPLFFAPLPFAAAEEGDEKPPVSAPIPSAAAEEDQEKGLVPIPAPILDHLEKAVADQLRASRKMIEKVTANKALTKEDRARSFGEMGQMYHAYELNDAAEVSYRNAVFLFPGEFRWIYSLAYLLQDQGRYAEAVELYGKAIALMPNAFLSYHRAGECYRHLDQPQTARKYLDAALARRPGEPAILARLGEVALGMREYGTARELLETALEREPQANRLHYPLAMAYRGLGDMEKARHHLKIRGIVGIQPFDPLRKRLEELVTGYRVRMLAGRLAFDAGRFVEAAEEFEKAVKEDPDLVPARVNFGTSLAKLGQYRKAMEQFKKALELSPDNVTIRFNLGSMYRHLGDFKGAVAHLSAVCSAKPEDAVARLILAQALVADGQFGEAFESFKAAAAADRGLSRAWLGMSRLLIQAGQHKEALQVLEAAHVNMPVDGAVAHALARLLAATPVQELRDGKRSLMMAEKVWAAVQAYDHAATMAMALAEQGRCEDAVSWQERAIDMAAKGRTAPSILSALNRNLDHYRSNIPCRVPWSAP